MKPRAATIHAEALNVCCPACGDCQPAPGGSEFWTLQEFYEAILAAALAKPEPRRICVSCEAPYYVRGVCKAIVDPMPLKEVL